MRNNAYGATLLQLINLIQPYSQYKDTIFCLVYKTFQHFVVNFIPQDHKQQNFAVKGKVFRAKNIKIELI